MIKEFYRQNSLGIIILALLAASCTGLLIPRLAVTGQAAVLLFLVFAGIITLFAVLRLTIDAAWVFILQNYFELIGFTFSFIRPDSILLWLMIVLPFPFVAIAVMRYPGYIVPALKDMWPWLFLVGFAFMSLSWSPDPAYGLNKVMILLVRGLIPGLFIFLLYKINPKFSWGAVLVISIIYSITVLIYGEELELYPGRITLPTGNPIMTARTCFLGAMVALWFRDGNKLLRLAAFILSIVVALQTQSRGPLVAFIAANAAVANIKYFADVLWGRLTWKKVLVSGMVLSLLIGSAFFINLYGTELDFGTRFNALIHSQDLNNDENVSARVDLQKEAFTMFLEHPLIGVGIGGFAKLGSDTYPHNLVMEIAAEMGVIGLFFWGVVIIKALTRAIRNHLVLSLLLQAIFFVFSSGDLGSNYEYVLVSVIALGLNASRAAEAERKV